MRRTIVELVAGLLGVYVTFPADNSIEVEKEPKNRDYRLTRKVWFDGTVHWYIEQFISELSTLKELFPKHPTNKMMHVNGIARPYLWVTLPQEFGTEEEAIEYLNETLRSCEVMEESHFYVD